MKLENKFLLEAFQVPKQVSTKIAPYFDLLPPDKYVNSDHRFRSYARFQAENGEVIKLPHSKFIQSSDVNRVFGDIERDFSEMSQQMITTDEFQHLIKSFMERTGAINDHSIVDVHQIRVTCDHDTASAPAPEGIHQDGFRYVGIFCVKRQNISGGYTQIFTSPVDQHPHMNTVLEENQFVILNDRRFFHHISETLSNIEGQKGVRDVFVFTA
ncbi:2OG-Fe dioxygenase family protein [Vibrio sp. AND4]|uniref:2OG-Fe dioxygenase family protein n=1 Tax=Vibrio sp. AND4 TaxID=314289 RepID=UPI00015EFAEC|nr:2OG-Fe dioxygenase family protein [Vibrio sp. AND4]EDP60251.1 hypothetical protein AND4_02543 [Vibrio sp. AND4]